MLTPEEVMKLLMPPNTDYIKTHGVDEYRLIAEDYTYLCVRHHRRLMTGPFKKGGRPYTGLRYEEFYDSDQLMRYTEIKDGYYFGDDVTFYDNGALASYERKDDEEHYRYDWDEDGVLQAVTEWTRKDNPAFFRKRLYDVYHNPGRLLRMVLECEITVIYQPNAEDSPYDFTFHENGEFRQITLKAPTARDFYSEIELNPVGIPVRFSVNPYYTEDKLGKRLKDGSPSCETFNRSKFRYGYYQGRMEHREPKCHCGWDWTTGCIHFRDAVNGDRIFEFQGGRQEGKQCIYYSSGRIQEEYFLSEEKELFRHIYWHPNGMMWEAIIYAESGAVLLRVTFDDKGNLLSYRLYSDVFKTVHRK